jgi:uncharacterized protein
MRGNFATGVEVWQNKMQPISIRGVSLMANNALMEHILNQNRFAVVGVSRDPEKYGYKVFKSLKAAGRTAFAVNPNADQIDGDPCYPTLDNIPGEVDVLVAVTPPDITNEILPLAGRLQIPFCWMQPGSFNEASINLARAHAMQVVADGSCIMVVAARAAAKEAAAMIEE